MLRLLKRGSAYYARVHVPTDLCATLNKAEIWKSLGTADYREAQARASLWEADITRLFATARREGAA